MIKRIEKIKKILDEKKAEYILDFDMSKNDYLFDYVVIATMLNSKHGLSLVDYLKEELKPLGEEFLTVDESEGWIVIDLGDILIHLMNTTYRSTYNIEEFLKEYIKSKK